MHECGIIIFVLGCNKSGQVVSSGYTNWMVCVHGLASMYYIDILTFKILNKNEMYNIDFELRFHRRLS